MQYMLATQFPHLTVLFEELQHDATTFIPLATIYLRSQDRHIA